MYYKELLRVGSALKWWGISMGALVVAHITFHLFFPVGKANDIGPISFVTLFGIAALFAGGMMATVFGTTLARENDGHLELAWTKPHSRTEYATSAMLVNAAGIMVFVLMGFVFLVLNLDPMGQHVTWNLSPSAANDILRFALFPLAWYGVIVALSARLRGGGLVQGLIWPVTIVLLVLSQIPFQPWHGLFAALNVVNPLSYIGYKDHSFSMLAGPSVNPATFAVLGLAVLAVGGWAFATAQWRRVEA